MLGGGRWQKGERCEDLDKRRTGGAQGGEMWGGAKQATRETGNTNTRQRLVAAWQH